MKLQNISIRSLLLALAMTGTFVAADAQSGTVIYTANTGRGEISMFGTDKEENYDVAIKLSDPALVGKKISKIRVPINGVQNIYNMSMWITKKLTLQRVDGEKVVVPDVMELEVEEWGEWAEVTLPEPYTITADPVYVGYSFDMDVLDETNARPVTVTSETGMTGFFIHSTSTFLSWIDKSDVASPAIEIDIDSDEANSVTVESLPELYGQTNRNTTVPLNIINHGYNGISSFDYTCTQGDDTYTGHIELDTPIRPIFNAYYCYDLEVPPIEEEGTYRFTVKIDKVNGVSNDSGNEVNTNITYYDVLAVHRPVMEEFTGTWCQYCPKGYVAMKVMNRLHPDFIGMAYHNSDPMQFTSNYPVSIGGYPTAVFDRKLECDPYYGLDHSNMGVEKVWQAYCDIRAAAAVEVTATLDESARYVSANATVAFSATPSDYGYKVEFCLVQDGMTGCTSTVPAQDRWAQTNYFRGGSYPEPEFEVFTQGGTYVQGLEYDDVVVASTRVNGNNVSLYNIKGGEFVDTQTTFDLDNIYNVYGDQLIQDKRRLFVVAIVVAPDGTIVNADKVRVNTDATAIESVAADKTYGTPSAVAVYDINGRRIDSLQKGINIIRLSNGETVKIIK